jgi:hypothetical protein
VHLTGSSYHFLTLSKAVTRYATTMQKHLSKVSIYSHQQCASIQPINAQPQQQQQALQLAATQLSQAASLAAAAVL